MRKLILRMNLSLDGFMGGPNGEIDWIFKSFDDSASSWTVETLWQVGVHIMGSRTFRDMAAYWPSSTDPIAAPMNEIPKVVFTRRGLEQASTTQALKDAPRAQAKGSAAVPPSVLESWANPGIARGELASEIARLKQQPGKPILAHGGASFARSLVRERLADEYWLLVYPVALGRGLAPFSDLDRPLDLKLVSSTAFDGGLVAHTYRPV
ncbi:dihydrofolate reductase family protein [Dongia deserti]|uniref:dihydrofolate reductase family protein n=1 Tax=Dongia deserti TaxID=2268030 RepID=UPI000E65AECD|nr:dihydrofolate reductase family protein [Dongia deserti]